MSPHVALTLIIIVLAVGVFGSAWVVRWALRGLPADDETDKEIWP